MWSQQIRLTVLTAAWLFTAGFASAEQNVVKVGVAPSIGADEAVPAAGTSFFVDLFEEIARRDKLPIELYAVPFGQQIDLVLSGEIDVGAAQFAATDERRRRGVDFTEPVLALEDSLLMRADGPTDYASLDEIRTGSVGYLRGTIWEAAIAGAGLTAIAYDDILAIVKAVSSGDVEAAIVSSANRYFLESEGRAENVRFSNNYRPTTRNNGSLMLRTDNKDLLKRINAAIRAIKSDDTFYPAMLTKYRYLAPSE